MYTKIPMELIKYQNWSSDNLFWGTPCKVSIVQYKKRLSYKNSE